MKGYSRYFWAIHFFGDFFLINLSFLLAFFLKFNNLFFSVKYIFLLIIFNFLWILTSFLIKLYDIKRIKRLDRVIFNLFKAGVINGIFISATLFALKETYYSREHLYTTYFFLFTFILIWRFIAIRLITLYRRSGFNYKRVIIIGGEEVAKQLFTYFNSDNVLGYKLLGIFFDKDVTFDFNPIIMKGNIKDVKNFVIKNNIDEIYYTKPLTYTDEIKDLIDYSDRMMIRFKIIPDFRGFLFKRVNIDFYDDVPVLAIRKEPLEDILNRLIKRLFDIVFSFSVIILILSWFLPLVGIIIKITSKGPVIFKQRRSGLDNTQFFCYKFRTMTKSDESETKQATKGDKRVTKIGHFLRKTSLDELPQFYNVFIGDMSVVGPRPHMIAHTNMYSELIKKYMVRQLVKPGITGAAQIRGFRGETKKLRDMEGRVRFDVWYIENWSLSVDINLIFLTIFSIFKGDEKAY